MSCVCHSPKGRTRLHFHTLSLVRPTVVASDRGKSNPDASSIKRDKRNQDNMSPVGT